jgi:hypothetical protein
MKQTLQLNRILKIKEDLEESIKRDDLTIQKSNSIIVGNDRSIDIREALELLGTKEKQLVHLKLAIQEANMKYHKDPEKGHETYSNFYYIYTLSNLKRKRTFYLKLNTTNGYKEGGKGTVNYSAEITQQEVNRELAELNQKIQEIEIKLANFNHNTEVEVHIEPELNLLV